MEAKACVCAQKSARYMLSSVGGWIEDISLGHEIEPFCILLEVDGWTSLSAQFWYPISGIKNLILGLNAIDSATSLLKYCSLHSEFLLFLFLCFPCSSQRDAAAKYFAVHL